MKRLPVLILAILFINTAFAQVGISSDGSLPDNRAILDVKSNTKGVLLPRMTTAERNSLYQDVPDGMLILNTTKKKLEIFFDNTWYQLAVEQTHDGASTCEIAPNPITGTTFVNQNDTYTYSTPFAANASQYEWTVPEGAAILSGQGTRSVSVKIGAVGGNISVRAICGTFKSPYVSLEIVMGPPQTGMQYAGGFIFYIDPSGQHGKVCATTDQGAMTWGDTILDANDQPVMYYFAIPACQNLVLGGYSDWYLPTMSELLLMYNNLKINSIGNFSGGYWSNDWDPLIADNIFYLDFTDGSTKSSGFAMSSQNVRAVRAF